MAYTKFDIRYTKLFINNEFVDAVSKRTFPTIDPCTEQRICEVAKAEKSDVDLAVLAAQAAFSRGSEWRSMDASQRGKLMHKLANLMERDMKYLAKLETLDNGKPLDDSLFDMKCAIDTMRYFAGWADKIHGKTIPSGSQELSVLEQPSFLGRSIYTRIRYCLNLVAPGLSSDGNLLTMTRLEPVGIVGQIIPWNYPVLMTTWKWGPAMAAGCCMVLKPAEQTPLTALYLASLVKEAGFPKGVVSVLPGYGPTAGGAIVNNMNISKVAFTGSTKVGRKIMENASRSNMKRISLELGGKSPLIVMDDFNLDEAVQIAHTAIFANHGQNCCAGSRTYVQSGIYDCFLEKAIKLAKIKKVGNPFEAGTEQGPQIDQEMFDKVTRMIESGLAEGATLETGGKRIGTEGYFIEPTVFSQVDDNMKIAREEIFGPVQVIMRFDNLEEVIRRANDTEYGLAAGILTNNLDNAMTFAQAVNAGSVWVNCYDAVVPQAPFGGYKLSGIGRELGEDALKEYLEVKTISIKVPKTH